MNLHNDHNVYILGAGFSADGGLPLIKNFLTRMRDSHPWLVSAGSSHEAEAVEAVLSFRLEATAAGYWTCVDLENLEELFSLASVEGTTLLDNMRYAIAATLDFCARTTTHKTRRVIANRMSQDDLIRHCPWLGNTSSNVPEIPSYAFYTARLLGMFNDGGGKPVGENTFITFNYDTLLEESLAFLKVPFDYGFDKENAILNSRAKACSDPKAIKVLKLHGSVNWAHDSTNTEKTANRVTVFEKYDDPRSLKLVPQLVPPTWRKVFDGPLADVWKQAIDNLRTATRIVVIGFSIPPTDTHFKFLMSSGLKENISLREIVFINPGAEELQKRVANVFRQEHIASGKIRFEALPLERYLMQMDFASRIGRPKSEKIDFTVT